MKSIFEQLSKFKLKTEEKWLAFSLKDSLEPSYQKSFNKKHFSKGCSLDIKAQGEAKIEAARTRAFELVNIYNKSTLGLLNYIEEKGYNININNYAKKLLALVEEKPGFIWEAKGLKALYINLISGNRLALKSEPMFFLETKNIDITEFLHDFYLWVAQDSGLPGLEAETRKIFIQYFVKGQDALLKRIQINQMLMLKEAVSRDKEAIEFVIDFEKSNKNPIAEIKNETNKSKKVFI